MTDPNTPWRWKVPGPEENARLGLLYEPGNWGDILKGTWALAAARVLLAQTSGRPFRYLDPFAGAPTYPLTPGARRRLDLIPDSELARAQEPYSARAELASTALLVRDLAIRSGREASLFVHDVDPARGSAWGAVPEAVKPTCSTGEDLLDAWRQEPAPDLVLIDPYDLFDRFATLLPRGLEAAQGGAVLYYLYNKSPRSGGFERTYRSLRRALDRALGQGSSFVVGRIPSDPILPRAFHEVILAGPVPLVSALAGKLREDTESLAALLARQGAFEPPSRLPEGPAS